MPRKRDELWSPQMRRWFGDAPQHGLRLPVAEGGSVFAGAAIVSTINPPSGSFSGGTPVTITGKPFIGATGVTIGGVAATSVVVLDNGFITCVTPAGTPGLADVVVITTKGTATGHNLYNYTVSGVDQYAISGTLPQLFANFTTEGAANTYWFNGALYAGVTTWLAAIGGTFSRASAAFYTNSTGLLASAATNVPRFDYLSLTPQGILLEGASTNNFLRSNTFTDAAWTQNFSAAAQNVTGPDGGANSAWTVTADAGLNLIRIYQGFPSGFAAGSSNSVFVKAGTDSFAYVWFVEVTPGSGQNWQFFNLNTGAIASTTHSGANTGTVSGATITPLANGWFRISASYSAAWYGGFGLCDADGNQFATTGTTGLCFGAQNETKIFASSYISTAAAPASRAADSFSVPWTATTFTARSKSTMTAETDNGRLLGADSNGLIYETSGPTVTTSNGSQTLNTSVNAWTAQNIIVVGGSPTGRVLSANGAVAVVDSSVLVPSPPSNVYVGRDAGGNSSYGDFAQFGLYTVAASAFDAKTLSGTP